MIGPTNHSFRVVGRGAVSFGGQTDPLLFLTLLGGLFDRSGPGAAGVVFCRGVFCPPAHGPVVVVVVLSAETVAVSLVGSSLSRIELYRFVIVTLHLPDAGSIRGHQEETRIALGSTSFRRAPLRDSTLS